MMQKYNILYKSHYPWSNLISRYTHLAISLAEHVDINSLKFLEPMRYIGNTVSEKGIMKDLAFLGSYRLSRSSPIPIYSVINPIPFRGRSKPLKELSNKWEYRTAEKLLKKTNDDDFTKKIALIQGPTEFSFRLLEKANDKGFFTIFDWANLYEGDKGSEEARKKVAILCRQMASEANMVITVSDQIRELACEFNPLSYTLKDALPGGIIPESPRPPRPERLESPVICYFGLINETKLDYNLMKRIGRLRPTWNFIYIGPVQGSQNQLSSTFPEENIRFLPPMDGESLHRYIEENVDLTFIPYNTDDIVAYYCSPLKLYEALAHGLGVVSTITFDPGDAKQFVARSNQVEELVQLMEEELKNDSIQKRQDCQGYARQNTWKHRAKELLTLLQENFVRK